MIPEALLRRVNALLPVPKALREAVDAGEAAITTGSDGTIAYFVRPGCRNRVAVLDAIATRTRWETMLHSGIGSVAGVVLVGILYALLN